MRERITKEMLKRMEERVNRGLKGSGNRIVVSGRYGYTALDIGYEKDKYKLKDTLRSGLTKTQAYDILYGMSRALDMRKEKLKKVM